MLPLVLWAILQAGPSLPVQVANPPLADCSGAHNAQSCRTFNGLVEHNDAALIRDVSTNAYVCFRQEADIFFVISFQQPVGSGHLTSSVHYELFKGGVSDDSRIASGDWRKAPGGYIFRQSKTSEVSALVADDEVQVGYSFKNQNGGMTPYRAQIRRSTLQFSEEYKYPAGQDQGRAASNLTGSCQEFAPAR
jgi:hypothetical protein